VTDVAFVPGAASSSSELRVCRGGGPRISAAARRVSAWEVPTDPVGMIARHTVRLPGLTAAA